MPDDIYGREMHLFGNLPPAPPDLSLQVLRVVPELPQPGEDGRHPITLRVQAPFPGKLGAGNFETVSGLGKGLFTAEAK